MGDLNEKQKAILARAQATGSGISDFKPAPTPESIKRLDYAKELLKKTFLDPKNDALLIKMYEGWKKLPENKGKDISKERLVADLLKAQDHIFEIQKNFPTSTSGDALKKKSWDKGTKKNETYNKVASVLGLDPMKEDEIANFQGAYRVLSDLADDPQFEEILKPFNLVPAGVSDQVYGKGNKAISPIDSWFGNTTVGQAILPKEFPEAKELEEAKKKTSPGPQRQEVGPYTRGRVDAPWWIQDVINTAAAAGTRAGLKKYLPWAPKVNLQTPRPTFLDPTRELAANAEQMVIGTQGAGMFAGPQAFNARFSGIQGQGAKNAADILSRYHNQNVGLANQFENLRTDVYNKNNQLNAGVAQKLYDQTTVANQQFDNAKRQANNEIRKSYVNALTNRAQTQTLNTMYPNFQVDPMSGGMLDFYKGSPVTPQMTQGDIDNINDLTSQGWSRADALKFYGYGSDKDRDNININQNPEFNAYMQQMQRMGNPQFGYGYRGPFDQEV